MRTESVADHEIIPMSAIDMSGIGIVAVRR
jgi:hypothetical protein